MVGNNSSSIASALVTVIAAMVYTATGNIVASFAFVNTASVIVGSTGLLVMFSCSKEIVMMYSRFVSTTPILILIIVVVVVVTSTANSSLTIIRGIVVVVVVKQVVVVVYFSCGTFPYCIVFFSFLKMICFFYLIALSWSFLKVGKDAYQISDVS